MKSRITHVIVRLLIAGMVSFGLVVQPVFAGMVETGKAAASVSPQTAREKIHFLLEREDLRAALQEHGVDVGAATARIDALSDEEVQRLAGRLDKFPAGGDVVGVLVFIFVLLLITDILGFTKVFNFTRPLK